MKRTFFPVAVLCLLLQGCFTLPWTQTAAKVYELPTQNMNIAFPEGWMKSNRQKDFLLLTRDGPLLQYIMVEPIHIDSEFTHTKKKFRRGMTPLEQAEVMLDQMASDPDWVGFKVLEKKPAKVAGHNGFRAAFSFNDTDGLAYRGIVYGFMQNTLFYGLHFVAASRHYFDRDKQQFENLVKSAQLRI